MKAEYDFSQAEQGKFYVPVEEVEVIVLPQSINALPNEQNLLGQAEQIGKIGFHSHSFVDDDEDYSQWQEKPKSSLSPNG